MPGCLHGLPGFPFLFGGTFIEGLDAVDVSGANIRFPFLFGGTFIEGVNTFIPFSENKDFPSFSEGLSLRVFTLHPIFLGVFISLPFRRDFH